MGTKNYKNTQKRTLVIASNMLLEHTAINLGFRLAFTRFRNVIGEIRRKEHLKINFFEMKIPCLD